MIATFWVAANILFDLKTGATTEVFMLVNREADASIFSQKEQAETAFSFVQRRAERINPRIIWHLDPPTVQRPQGYVIRGEQLT